MTMEITPVPRGPALAFVAAIVQACPDMVPFQVAAMFVQEPVGLVHQAFARHLTLAYLASLGDPVIDAERIATITVDSTAAMETVRSYGLERAAWEALTFVQEMAS
jgi:hypothetical protein